MNIIDYQFITQTDLDIETGRRHCIGYICIGYGLRPLYRGICIGYSRYKGAYTMIYLFSRLFLISVFV